MSGGEKSQLLKKNCWQKVVENWDTCKKKKISLQYFYNTFTSNLSFRLLWDFIGGAKKLF